MIAADWWEGPLLGFDVESTGVDVFADRIVTAAVVDIQPGQRPKTTAWLVDPRIEIPEGATAIHGISTEHARAAGTDIEQALFEISGRIAVAMSQGTPVVAFNAAFDFSMLEAENDRYNLPTLAHRLSPNPIGPVVDPHVMDKGLDPRRKGKRTLAASCEHYGVTLAGAHTSDADAIAACRLAVVMAKAHAGVRAMPLLKLHAAQIEWRRKWAASFSAYLVSQGRDASDVSPEWPVRYPSTAQGALA